MLFFVLLFLLLQSIVYTAPALINYQGRLINNSGQPIINSIDVSFTFWDSETSGTQLGNGFSDTDSIIPDMNGIYSTLIGDDPGNLVPESIFDNDSAWLNIEVNGEKLVPRKQITSVGYAVKSSKSDDTDTLDQIDSLQFLRSDQDSKLNGALIITGNVGIKTESPSQALDINGSVKTSSVVSPLLKASDNNSISTIDFDSLPNNAQNSGITIGKIKAAAGQNNGQPYLWIRANGAHSWILDNTPSGTFWAQSMGAYYNNVKQGNIGFVGTGPTVDYISMGFGGAYWWNNNSKFMIWKSGRAQFMPSSFGNGTGTMTEPSAWLVLAPGTSVPSGAPIKFREGINLTNPEAGAMEWDGNNLYITKNTLERKTIAYTDSTLHIVGTDLNFVDRYTDTAGAGAGLALRRARGSSSSPSAVQSDDLLGSINFRGYNGTDFSQTAAAVFGFAAENWDSSSQGSYVTIHTTEKGEKSLVEKMRITDSGNVGIGTANPEAKLHIMGQSDQVQSKIQANSNQTNDLSQWLGFGGSVLANIDNTGVIKASGYKSSDGSEGLTGTQVIVTGVTQDPVTKNIVVTTKTITFKNGLITSID